MSERINDIKTNLERWTDSEIVNGIGYAVERKQAAEADITRLIGVAGTRGLLKPELVQQVEGQVPLFVIESDNGTPPPAA